MKRLDLLRRTHADYSKLRKALDDLPHLAMVAVARTSESAAMDRELFDRVTVALGDNGAVGWARFRSELGWSGCLPPGFEISGPPIMAEWLDGNGVAHRLTPAPNVVGRALIVAVSDRTLGEGDGLEEREIPALRQRVEVLAHKRIAPLEQVAYDVYWGLPPNGSQSATRRLFDRFAGFLPKKEG